MFLHRWFKQPPVNGGSKLRVGSEVLREGVGANVTLPNSAGSSDHGIDGGGGRRETAVEGGPNEDSATDGREGRMPYALSQTDMTFLISVICHFALPRYAST